MKRFLSAACLSSMVALILAPADALEAQPSAIPEDIHELIVLLRPGAAAPQEVVDAVNERRPVPGGLGEGNPMAAHKVLREPARHRMAEWIAHNPDTPEGRSQRYIVLRYRDNVNFDALLIALSNNPNVENVEPNLAFEFHSAPTNDPWIGDSDDYDPNIAGDGDPTVAQWGVHILKLPAAWNRIQGHAYLGIIDEGLETAHSELRLTHTSGGSLVFDGGGYRAHLSRDVANLNCSVDEVDPQDTPGNFDPTPGHGSHVMGIAAASTDNGEGVAGACRSCSVEMVKAHPSGNDEQIFFDRLSPSLQFVRSRGAQAVNMSFGINSNVLSCVEPLGSAINLSLVCNGVALAERFDLVMVASAGNKAHPQKIDFPARDPRTISAGGLELGLGDVAIRWDEGCVNGSQCGSNTGPGLDLMAPAKEVLSTMYAGFDHTPDGECGDSNFVLDGPDGGYGLCTGTSMSAPYITGLAGLVRSANPLLGKEDVRDAMTSTASNPAGGDLFIGFGTPDAGAAVDRAFGRVAGDPLANRLTPLFSLHSPPAQGAPKAETHVYTTVPQAASAWLLDDVRHFDTEGSLTPMYPALPGFCSVQAVDCCPVNQACCVGQDPVTCVSKILVAADTQPRASVYVFTSDAAPISPAQPASAPLVPLFRLRYESLLTDACPSPPDDLFSPVRDFTLATSADEVTAYLNGVDLGGTIYKYKLDGIEGYVYQDCASGCPPGVVALHRLYSSARHDTVVVPDAEVAVITAMGYLPPSDPTLPEVIGYAFPNADFDFDGLVDGFERLIGSKLDRADSDGDGVTDGQELLVYDRSSPDPALHGYRDPCSGGCPLFDDGFETGDTSKWSSTVP